MRYLILFIITFIIIINGCGFHLHDTDKIPKELKILKLNINNSYGHITHIIKQQLKLNNIRLMNEAVQNIPILKIENTSKKIETVSIYQDGKSAEKKLIFFLNVLFILPNGTSYPINVRVERTFFDNPLEILAREAENEVIKQEIYEEAVCQLIDKLLIIYGNI
ncbi:LPS-assembly lipoprotein LptE precursor [Candidatus Arsenophonus lipoptenae]|uniref:LPS-assembly lipoprotein LptE n=1 Tax=Candidatus Arsenophonus lipoptenae TaxID=634113 RepID=A0A120HPY1_9GAMM|nr:LPS assembly lipoprotein LptE [Candidatus Arsenophonus lipoptenae]AMA65143.1 LPS-assembly lipoprotein LptE precursor [Candidatus Arsenophonus lipoptenae]